MRTGLVTAICSLGILLFSVDALAKAQPKKTKNLPGDRSLSPHVMGVVGGNTADGASGRRYARYHVPFQLVPWLTRVSLVT